MTLTTVIDVGNFSTKYSYQKDKETKVGSFSSVIHPYKELDHEDSFTRIQYNNLDYFVGEKVKNFYSRNEDKMYFGNTKKGHHESQIRLLSALYNIYKKTGERSFNLILTSPYKSMEKDKEYFIKNFEGKRSAYVDENPFEFEIQRIVVAAEGLGAIHYSSSPNCVVVDAGSMTTNVLYFINGSISKEDSVTINGGTINQSMFQISNTFAKSCPYIEYDYPIVCTGGKAEELKTSLEMLGYEDVMAAKIDKQPTFFVNSVGLLLKYSSAFEEMFK